MRIRSAARWITGALSLAAFVVCAGAAIAQAVDLQLVLAVDVSRSVDFARDQALARGITTNGLPILNDDGGPGTLPDLDVYYKECVVGGPGSFVIAAENFHSFGQAILRKLILEVAGVEPAGDFERI